MTTPTEDPDAEAQEAGTIPSQGTADASPVPTGAGTGSTGETITETSAGPGTLPVHEPAVPVPPSTPVPDPGSPPAEPPADDADKPGLGLGRDHEGHPHGEPPGQAKKDDEDEGDEPQVNPLGEGGEAESTAQE